MVVEKIPNEEVKPGVPGLTIMLGSKLRVKEERKT